MKYINPNPIRNLLFAGMLLALASCAKENFPVDDPVQAGKPSLYMVQAGLVDNMKFRLYPNVANPDTSFNLFKVAFAGNEPAPVDIPIKFEVLGKEYVDAYNSANYTGYDLLPAEAYNIEENATIKKGTTSTPTMPMNIDMSKLQMLHTYVLPVKFTTTSDQYPIDAQRQIVYYVFKATSSPYGQTIGWIPELSDPRTRIFEFFDDIMFVDTLGDLWIYPLKDRETLGDRYKVGSGFDSMQELFYNEGAKMLMAVPYVYNSKWPGQGMWAIPITEPPNPILGKPLQVYYTGLTAYQRWISATNGKMICINNNSIMRLYWLNQFGVLQGGTQIGSGWREDWYRRQAYFVQPDCDFIACTFYTDVLYAYLWRKDGTGSNNNWRGGGPNVIGSGFFKYEKILAVRRKDLVAYLPNGRVDRYKDIDIDNFYLALK